MQTIICQVPVDQLIAVLKSGNVLHGDGVRAFRSTLHATGFIVSMLDEGAWHDSWYNDAQTAVWKVLKITGGTCTLTVEEK